MDLKKAYILASNLSKKIKDGENPIEFMYRIEKNPNLKGFISNLNYENLMKVSFLSFAIKEKVNIKEFVKEYLTNLFVFSLVRISNTDAEVDCSVCDANGDLKCGECGGNGDTSCSNCDGDGNEECTNCDGTGELEDGEPCDECQGGGTLECNYCDGSGWESCEYCGGSGRESCNDCDGTGYVDAIDQSEAEQYYYVSLDTRLFDLLMRKEKNSVVNEKLLEFIQNSKKTFLLSMIEGLIDDYDFENIEDEKTYFTEISNNVFITPKTGWNKLRISTIYDYIT